MNREKFIGCISMFFGFALAGSSVIAARVVSGSMGTFTITAVSMFFALLVLVPLSYKNLLRTVRQMKLKDWLQPFLQALIGIFLFRLFLLQGLLRTSTAEAGILTGATPAVTAILAWAVLRERIHKRSWLGIISTVCGVLLLQGVLAAAGSFSMAHFLGNLLVLGAACSESLFNILSRIHSLRSAGKEQTPLNPTVQTTLVAGIALLLCLIPALFEQPVKALSALSVVQWAALVWYGVGVTALAFFLWYNGIKRCSAHTAAAYSGMMPFTSFILSVILLGERAGWQQWFGGVMIILGIVLIGTGSAPVSIPKVQKIETIEEQVAE